MNAEIIKDYGVGITGLSHKLGSVIQTNEELHEKIPDASPAWIISKTGIKRRYHISKDESASSLGIAVCQDLLSKTGTDKSEIGLLIVASFSQDYLFPPMSAKIHNALGLGKQCQIMDINTNCTGLVTALTTAAERMMFDSSIKKSLVVGVEVLSPFTNSGDIETAIFFSDGAGGVLLSQVEPDKGYQFAKFLTDSSTYESVRMRGGGSNFPAAGAAQESHYIEQNGLATWKQAITNLPIVINLLLEEQHLTSSDIDFVIFHQANHFLINYIMKKMKIPLEKTYLNVEEIGNTGSASIGIALSEAFGKGHIKPGHKVLLAGVGAGFNFGACIFKF